MKILFISTLTTEPWGGCEELWSQTALAAIAGGHEVMADVVRWNETPPRILELQFAGVEILRYSRLNTRLGRFRHRTGYRPFAPQAKRDFDLLVISQSGTHDFAMWHKIEELRELTKDFRIPYIFICHLTIDWGLVSDFVRSRSIEMIDRAACVCFVSEHNRAATEHHLAHKIPHARIVRNPVNLSSTEPLPWPSNSKAIFCSTARLDTTHKGHDVVLTALAEPQWRERDWELWLCGRGPDQSYLEELVKYYNLSQRVMFRGQISDIRKLWESTHMLVMPSRYEGTPLALVEAMLCGRPGVVTDVGGNTEWIREGESGFVAQAAMPKYFSLALERAWSARERWQEFGGRAREIALKQYDPKPGETLLKILADAATKGAGRS
jgi:glycosyltransferase involved in cell wall biosynthesis